MLIFAVACSGDNPSPAETPAVNTSGATQSDIRRYADIASSLMTQMVPLDDELRTLFFQNAGREHVTISNEAGTFSFTGSVDSDGFPSGGVAKLDGYSFLVTEADGRTTRTTTWGEFTSAGKNGTYDFTIRLDDEGKTFEPSADPLLGYAKEALRGITLGYTGRLDQLNEILSNQKIFGVNLFDAGLADLVLDYFRSMIAGPGAVRATLKKVVG